MTNLNRDDALAIVHEYVKNESLVNHMLSVEAAMRFYAKLYGEDEDKWGVVGILHDFDWEIHPDAARHPKDGAPILREKGVDEEIIRAILSHAPYTDVSRDSMMEKTLYAVDELTGLVTAVALVRPSKSIHDVKVSSVKKKWKNLAFAAGANRDEMQHGAEELGIELWEHVGNVIKAMQLAADEIGLAGIDVDDVAA
jgi:putative nucleotidyltransferase with HDIG domain